MSCVFQTNVFQNNVFQICGPGPPPNPPDPTPPGPTILPRIVRDYWDSDEWGRFIPGAGYH